MMLPTKKPAKKPVSLLLILVAAICISAAAPLPVCNASSYALGQRALSGETQQELAQARSATARYHDVEQAESDGYINIGLYIPNEGLHFVNFGLIDGTFDPAHPEVLLYALTEDGELQLVGVEYLVPLSSTPPQGFSGDGDQWRSDAEGFGLWELTVWLWLSNPEGVFADDNPRVP